MATFFQKRESGIRPYSPSLLLQIRNSFVLSDSNRIFTPYFLFVGYKGVGSRSTSCPGVADGSIKGNIDNKAYEGVGGLVGRSDHGVELYRGRWSSRAGVGVLSTA